MKVRQSGHKGLVFISHDHREQAAAECLADAISDVSSGLLSTFYSSAKTAASGIEYGEEWFQKVQQKLSLATDIVCILTPQSMHRPWIYFEAGFARGKHGTDTPVVALLVGVNSTEAGSGPFAQFKFVNANHAELTLLLRQIAERAGFAPTRSVIEAAAENLIKRLTTFSTEQKGTCSLDALRAYRACILHSKLTFGLIEYLNERDKADDAEINEWIRKRSDLSPSEAHRRRVLFSLLDFDILRSGAKRVGITNRGLLIYENLINIDKNPDPIPGELDVYRGLLKNMNFVPKILKTLFSEAPGNKMSHSALMKIVRGEWEPSELPRNQAETAFAKVFDMLREAGVVEGEEGQTIQLTRQGHAMCSDLFSV